jgi:lipopolysaccharide/colanic/teichoic acid biosynthesis glycosyltransferase
MFIKRLIDIIISFIGIIILIPTFLFLSSLVLVFSGVPIFFFQKRVGKNGKIFKIIKFRTMIKGADKLSGGYHTKTNDPRITMIGKKLRRWKLDELPSLWNVFVGDMSFVGPRPDVIGYANNLIDEDSRILNIRPGITGPATLKYAKEEEILSNVKDYKKYNDEVIFPDKVKINLDYINNWSFFLDIKIIFKTIFRKNY